MAENLASQGAEEEGDDPMVEEIRQAQSDLKTSTQRLIRQFSLPQNQSLLDSFGFKVNQDSEFSQFMDTWATMGELVNYNLTTPQEEVQNNEEQKI